jgi:predicted PurR-regulated permease PerM
MTAPASEDRAFNERAVRIGITTAVIAAVMLGLLWLLKAALTPLALAFVVAYLFDPLIHRIQSEGVRRRVAIFVLLGVTFAAALAFLLFVVPVVQRQLVSLIGQIPDYLDRVLGWAVPRVEAWGLTIPKTWAEALEEIRSGRIALPLDTIRGVVTRIFSSMTGTAATLVGLLVVPVIAYYMLVDFDRVKAGILSVVPVRYKDDVVRRAVKVDELLSGFLRGQLTVCLTLGVLYALGFTVIGVPMAVVIGLASGFLAIVPYLGNVVALGSAVLMCLLEFGFDLHLAFVVGWYVVVQNLEGFVLTPRIVGGSVGLHPVTVIVALLIGGDLLGFLGLLVAVPVAAVVQVFVRELLDAWRDSAFYAGGSADGV